MNYKGIAYDIDLIEFYDRLDDYCVSACVVSDCGKYVIWGQYSCGEFEPDEIEEVVLP